MIDQKLRELLDFAKTTDLQELVWEKNGVKISFRRAEGKSFFKPTAAAGAASSPEIEVQTEPEPMYIRSTMVGTFYRSDSTDRPPMVVEGTVVTSGQPVASIEAMKIRKDVVSQEPCRIIKALVSNGHAVEYDQPLFEVEPANGNGNGNGHV
jgi:oxaloacetate decarboxylase (Na+ extruding) subunit alpha